MEELKGFLIPLQGLKNDLHYFDFQLDKAFFKSFENAPVVDGVFQVKLELDKRPDMLVLSFDILGSVKSNCDRCLAAIDFPIQDKQQLLFKYGEAYREEAEVIYITRATTELNIAKYIFECACLAVPMLKYCEASGKDCNEEMLQYLDAKEAPSEEESTENPIWDELKKFNHKN